MLNSKFDINSPEWIDRVFENRNKSYGAYDLRKHYAGNLSRALAITLFAFTAVFGISAYVIRDKPESVSVRKADVNNKNIKVIATPVKGNDKSENGPVKFGDADIKPLPVGGATAWARFLENNLRYPAEAKDLRITGSVLLSFIVERDGKISNINVEQPAGHGFDEEAVRVISLSPMWIPGKQNGQTVRVKYSLPINFNIQRQ